MASSLLKQLRLTSSLLTRSVVPLRCQTKATGVVPSRFLSRGITTFKPLDSNHLVTLSRILDQMPIPSISCSCSISKEESDTHVGLTINMLGVEEMKETDEGLYVLLNMPGRKKEDVKAYIEHNKLFITGKLKQEEYYYNMCIIKLPENVNTATDITGEMQDGMFNVILPVHKELKTNGCDFANCSGLAAKPFSGTFNPSKAGRILMSLLLAAMPETGRRSFSMCTKETAESLHVKLNIPGLEDILVTKSGTYVSLNMPGFKMEDVKSSAEYNTFFIEGKTQNEHYITGVDLGAYAVEADNMKEEMQDGTYEAVFPWRPVDDQKLKCSSNEVQIKINRN